MHLTIYIHPSCPASRNLVLYLHEKGLLNRVELVSTARPSTSGLLREAVWSVPWLVGEGVPLATDPIEPGEAELIIREFRTTRTSNPLDDFAEAILHSAYASAVAYLHGSLEPVLDCDFVMAATRAKLRGLDVSQVLLEAGHRAADLYADLEDKIMRALGISYVRELYWASGGSLSREELVELATPIHVGAWLIAKASLGRSGLPSKPVPDKARLERLASFVRRGAAGLLRRIEREYQEVMEDENYWRILEEHGLA
ncbi:hypothetical protein [Hyperthermus butylicus]|uniref:Conserved crenarchaeal protein n=1 Tax=Hyperthermus butylicus (strain DSM 5456 / JCM 9403 / PLM1-5) TaxID=415426 RepID=A2BMJ9_HYPBU|nr:hypothetical protein [Hyperthermus butylicus]ABM81210.1 conserved crenarchaeal protein [Hyperthermus butylicus DSM 5456]